MKRIIIYKLILYSILLSACNSENNQQKSHLNEINLDHISIEKKWVTGKNDLITPECATFYPEENIFFVSNLNRDNESPNNGFISIVNYDGTVQNAKWVEGLSSPLGNDYHNGFLYVNDNGQIVQIDIKSGKITDRINIEGASDLNGIDIDKDGTIYVADSDGNKIFRIRQNREIELIFEGEQLNSPNGVFIKEENLIVASSGGNSLLTLNLESNELTTLVAEGLGHADGIISLDEGHYIISSWTGELYFVSNNLNLQKILDTSTININAADITYIPQDSLIVVPTFFDNQLIAYKIKY